MSLLSSPSDSRTLEWFISYHSFQITFAIVVFLKFLPCFYNPQIRHCLILNKSKSQLDLLCVPYLPSLIHFRPSLWDPILCFWSPAFRNCFIEGYLEVNAFKICSFVFFFLSSFLKDTLAPYKLFVIAHYFSEYIEGVPLCSCFVHCFCSSASCQSECSFVGFALVSSRSLWAL